MRSLTHCFLLPSLRLIDSPFCDDLIYVCSHSKNGSWGFVVNRPSATMSVGGLLLEMGVEANAQSLSDPAFEGGPERPEAGFVLHTGLPDFQSSFAVSENVCLTTSRDVLQSLAQTPPFSRALVLMGFCRWQGGELESQLRRGDWLSVAADSEILFAPAEQKLDLAEQKLNGAIDCPFVGFA